MRPLISNFSHRDFVIFSAIIPNSFPPPRSLQYCIEENPDICELIGDHMNEKTPRWPVHVSVLAALHIHKDDLYVFQAACTTLSHLALNSQTLQKELMSKGKGSMLI